MLAGVTTNVRRRGSSGIHRDRHRTARRSVQRADARHRRPVAGLRRRRRCASRRIRICVFRWVNACDVRQLYRRLAPRRTGPCRGRHRRGRGQLPWRRVVPAGGHAVAGTRPAARGPSAGASGLDCQGRWLRASRCSGCPNGCGQHHIATIGFQGSVRRMNGRAVPQYFVHGRRRREREWRDLRRGSRPRCPRGGCREVVERLIDLYARERKTDESANDVLRSREGRTGQGTSCADLEQFTAGDAVPRTTSIWPKPASLRRSSWTGSALHSEGLGHLVIWQLEKRIGGQLTR